MIQSEVIFLFLFLLNTPCLLYVLSSTCILSKKGFFSFRHPENGTWFIQSLCEELNAHGTSIDLLKLLTRVSRRVAINFQSYNDSQPWFDEQKQIPSINSMLIRDVYFRPKRPAIDLSLMI